MFLDYNSANFTTVYTDDENITLLPTFREEKLIKLLLILYSSICKKKKMFWRRYNCEWINPEVLFFKLIHEKLTYKRQMKWFRSLYYHVSQPNVTILLDLSDILNTSEDVQMGCFVESNINRCLLHKNVWMQHKCFLHALIG